MITERKASLSSALGDMCRMSDTQASEHDRPRKAGEEGGGSKERTVHAQAAGEDISSKYCEKTIMNSIAKQLKSRCGGL